MKRQFIEVSPRSELGPYIILLPLVLPHCPIFVAALAGAYDYDDPFLVYATIESLDYHI
jgi:hypothetical protein